tara:strand:- start:291 stop:554 length:264 start_codon:yes stop_codon:yes gene_type:complete
MMITTKVIMVSVLLSSGFTTQTTFLDMNSCLKHQQELINQKNIETSCLYTDNKPKTEMDYLTERLGRKLLILFDAKITQIMNEQMKE